MGEAPKSSLRLDFDRRLKLEFRGATVASDAGLPAFRELDESPLRLTEMAVSKLTEGRSGAIRDRDAP